jgi:hypothetical protein
VREKGVYVLDVANKRLTVDKVLICLFRHPYRHMIRRWNWKAAFLSTFFRGFLILMANLSFGRVSAAGAMFVEICYRALTSGFYSSITQSFRYAQPAWAASLMSMVLLPVISETIEFGVHRLRGAQQLGATITASVAFTVFATLIELFAMRHGILVVGQNSRSIQQDIKNFHRLIHASLANFQRLFSTACSKLGKAYLSLF